MEMSFGRMEDRAALRLATNDSASMLFRFVDVALDRYPILIWDWYIEQPSERVFPVSSAYSITRFYSMNFSLILVIQIPLAILCPDVDRMARLGL